MIAIRESKEAILFPNAPPSDTLNVLVSSLSTPGVTQIIITYSYHWIRIKVIFFSKKVSKRPYQETTLPQSVFVCFLDVHGNISFHTSWWATDNLLLAVALTSSLIFLLLLFIIWLCISRHRGVCLTFIDSFSYFLQNKTNNEIKITYL